LAQAAAAAARARSWARVPVLSACAAMAASDVQP